MNKKFKYMHLINNIPAYFSKPDGQICYCSKENWARLVNTYKQIRIEQLITKKNRKRWGYRTEHDYSYIKVII